MGSAVGFSIAAAAVADGFGVGLAIGIARRRLAPRSGSA